MPMYELGRPFVPGVLRWPEHTEYAISEAGRGQELRLFRRGPTAADAAALTEGPGDLAAACLSGVLFLLYRFVGETVRGGWSAAAFRRGHTGDARTPRPGRIPDTAAPDELSVYLVDADTGVLRGLRRVALPAGMASGLSAALRAEEAKPFHGDYAYQREVSRAQSPYPSATAMLPHALASCHFGKRAAAATLASIG